MKFKTYILIIVFLSIPFLHVAQNSDLVSGKNGMVATAHPLATRVALEILQKNGNAIDAAIAAAFAIGVVEPDGSGIGGGGGMVIYLKEKKQSYYINYYPEAPSNLPENFNSKNDRHTGRSICVPGTVAGLLSAHKKFGSLPLTEVLKPAISLAKEGFAIDATLGGLILDNSDILSQDSATASVYLNDGFPKMQGDLIIQNELANTLTEIAIKGRDGFYKGHIAEAIVTGINARGGNMSLKDFEDYEAEISEPLSGSYREYKVLSAKAPQSGVSVIEGMNILENINLTELGHYVDNTKTLYLITETFREIYTDRFNFLGDPDFVDVPVEGLTSKEFAKERYNEINQYGSGNKLYEKTEMASPLDYEKGRNEIKKIGKKKLEKINESIEYEGNTTHLSVIDKYGNAVSLTQTLGTFFGSAQTISGVLLNCSIANFSTATENPNKMEKNKQPRTTIAPTIILKDDNPYLIIGTPGGIRIISTIIQVIVNVLDFDMNVDEANRAPRFFSQDWDGYLHVESGISQNVISELEKIGYKVRIHEGTDLFFGGIQMIIVDPETGIYYGSADIRRGGQALGY